MSTRTKKSIIYVNYSPYENSGKILDFMLENFSDVFVFSVGFHSLKNKKNYNILYRYKDGKLLEEKSLFSFYVPIYSKFVFFLIPIRSFLNFVQIFWQSFLLRNKFGTIDIYFSVNAFTVWIGNLLKKCNVVKKTIFWVWDYYPPKHDNKIIMFMRHIYWQFDKVSSNSDHVVYVNKRLIDLRKDAGILSKDASFPIVPVGTDIFFTKPKQKPENLVFAFIGVLKKSQGFDIVYKNAKEVLKKYPNTKYEIVGSGPDEEFFKKKAKESLVPSVFHGYVEGELFNKILNKCTIGIATYVPDKRNVAHYGDPGKIKRYLSLGIPVIATDVIAFSKEIEKFKAGIIVDYDNHQEFITAIETIMRNYKEYSRNALLLSKKYYYKDIYKPMFAL